MNPNKFMHSRAAMILATLLMILAAWQVFASGDGTVIAGDRGIALPSANLWPRTPLASALTGIGSTLLIMGMMLFLNRRFNLLRDLSVIGCTIFAAMQTATPMLTAQLYTGQLLALAVAACFALLFSCYGNPWRRQRVFLAFFILSAGVSTQYSFAVYIPVMLVCCWQMRIMSGRTLVAVALGILTPWWLLFGLGIISPDMLHVPHLSRLLSVFSFTDGALLAATLLLTVGVLAAAVVFDLFRTIAYNARSRSYNGTIILTGIVTAIAMAVDYNNVASYVPLLNMLAALQGAQFFIIHRTERSWIGILALLCAYMILSVCNILA